MTEDKTVGRYRHTIATCAAGIIGTTFRQICGYPHAQAAEGLHATTVVALYPIQKNHSAEPARRINLTSGELVET